MKVLQDIPTKANQRGEIREDDQPVVTLLAHRKHHQRDHQRDHRVRVGLERRALR